MLLFLFCTSLIIYKSTNNREKKVISLLCISCTKFTQTELLYLSLRDIYFVNKSAHENTKKLKLVLTECEWWEEEEEKEAYCLFESLKGGCYDV